MNIQAKRGRKTHKGQICKTLDDVYFFLAACNQTSTGWHKEPRAEDVTCRKCLRKIAKGIQNDLFS